MQQMWNLEEMNKSMQQWMDMQKMSEQLSQTSKQNMETWKQASSVMADTWNAYFERQLQMAQATMEESAEQMRELSSANGIEELMSKQSMFAKQSTETVQKNSQELAQIVQKGQQKATDLVSKQVAKSFESVSKTVK